jgi:enoyl-CoA hydratase/carnithine racemase
MMTMPEYKDIGVELANHVATIEIQRPPHNFFDVVLINSIADALDALDADNSCRAVVLAAQGKSFCAGANFGDGSTLNKEGQRPGEAMSPISHLYIQAVRLFRSKKPIIGAIHGAAVGGGLGLAMVPDLRVTCPEARFCANFTRLGFHPGFGLTTTLAEVVGKSNAAMMFYTSRRVTGEEALAMGLADVLVPQDQVRAAAQKLAAEIAENAPLGITETRATMRAGLADRIMKATEHELAVQTRLRATDDFKEGVKAMSERRVPNFAGR